MASLLENNLLDLKIDSSDKTYIKNPFDLFPKRTTSIWMEIGFGGGDIGSGSRDSDLLYILSEENATCRNAMQYPTSSRRSL